MNLLKLSYSYLRRRALTTILNVLLLSFGIATVTVLVLFSFQLEDNLYKNARGVDVVVGAKGSPIQLILSGIFHIDSPTGNIKMSEAKKLMNHRLVETVIPLALGDSYKGYRIVGTTSSYITHYEGEIEEGDLWNEGFEVVIGSHVRDREGIAIGDEIISSHGLSSGGSAHDNHRLTVSGILKPTETVLDRLILTSVETMWGIHEYGDPAVSLSEVSVRNGKDEHRQDIEHVEDTNDHSREISVSDKSYLQNKYLDKELTSLLISYTTPLGAAQFPRFVNSETTMQAAAPAFEITRLLNLLGVGFDAIEVFGYILILAAILGIFIALLNSMQERKYDLAIMRTLGGSRIRLFSHIILEGMMISVTGGLMGMALGHFAVEGIGLLMIEAQQFAIRGFVILPDEFYIFLIALAIGVVSSVIPAIQAYKTEISEILSKS